MDLMISQINAEELNIETEKLEKQFFTIFQIAN
jgi:hypothetical protein